MTKKIVENNDGQLNFDSVWQKGSTFIFTFQLELNDNPVSEHAESSDEPLDISPRFANFDHAEGDENLEE